VIRGGERAATEVPEWCPVSKLRTFGSPG
jgi:hypothetical protein